MLKTVSISLIAAMLWAERSSAQEMMAGTAPEAEAEILSAGNDADWRSQTFVAEGSYLTSLSIWFYGGTRLYEDFYSRLYINSGAGFFPEGPMQLYRQALDQSVQGRYDFWFPSLQVTPGSFYTFSIFTNNCGPSCGDIGAPLSDEQQNPFVEVTTEDAYAGGSLIYGRGGIDQSRDIRFRATFASVPEPTVWMLLVSGMLLLVLSRSVQRRTPQHPLRQARH